MYFLLFCTVHLLQIKDSHLFPMETSGLLLLTPGPQTSNQPQRPESLNPWNISLHLFWIQVWLLVEEQHKYLMLNRTEVIKNVLSTCFLSHHLVPFINKFQKSKSSALTRKWPGCFLTTYLAGTQNPNGCSFRFLLKYILILSPSIYYPIISHLSQTKILELCAVIVFLDTTREFNSIFHDIYKYLYLYQ